MDRVVDILFDKEGETARFEAVSNCIYRNKSARPDEDARTRLLIRAGVDMGNEYFEIAYVTWNAEQIYINDEALVYRMYLDDSKFILRKTDEEMKDFCSKVMRDMLVKVMD